MEGRSGRSAEDLRTAEVDRSEQAGQIGRLLPLKEATFINANLTPLKQMRGLIAASRFRVSPLTPLRGGPPGDVR